MRQMAATPFVVPEGDFTVYIVLNDLGSVGPSYRETDTKYCDRAAVVVDLLYGQFHNPLRVVAFNTAQGWAVDASQEIARAVIERALAENQTLPRKVLRFCERHIHEDVPAQLIAA